MSNNRTVPIVAAVIVFGLFVASSQLEAGYYRGKFLEEGVTGGGWALFVMGWLSFPLSGPLALAWFANPLSLVGLIYLCSRKYSASAAWSSAAFLLSSLPLGLFIVVPDVRVETTPAFVFIEKGWEGSELRRVELRIGYFVWLAANGLLWGFGVFFFLISRNRKAAIESRALQLNET